ncbi:MAG: D-hexose-6-phosphate mutarotase [Anaerolineales bacterium]|nr:D-hexose-6-phosphate mutarotase [Anaerolineales bacterium]
MNEPTSSGIGGLQRVVLVAADGARSEIYLHGAHVTSWVPAAGKERLYLSELAEFRADAAIRGGIPVIFPQFSGLGSLPKHGFARITTWDLVGMGQDVSGHAMASFRLPDSAATRELWPGRFVAELTVRLAGQRVDVTLAVTNAGATPFGFTTALHTYLRVHDVEAATVEGLQGLRFRDSAAGGVESVESAARLAIQGEVDRIYYAAPASLLVHEPERITEVRTDGFSDVVVWNPGAERGAALRDLAPGDFRFMLCIEAAVIEQPVHLAPGETWRGTQALIAQEP